MADLHPQSNGTRPSPIAATEVAATRKPTEGASLLPPRVYHDPDVLAYELEEWFAKGWIFVGREEEIELPGQYFLTQLCGENLIIVRDNDDTIRAFFNFCRHRGATLLEEERGRVPRIQCPYHAWVYDLDGTLHKPRHTDMLEDFDLDEFGLYPVNLATWQGFIYVNISNDAEPLLEVLDDMPAYFERYDLAGLRRARHHRVRRQGQLEGDHRELLRVLPLPRRPPPAQQDHALQPGRVDPERGAVEGELDARRSASTTP